MQLLRERVFDGECRDDVERILRVQVAFQPGEIVVTPANIGLVDFHAIVEYLRGDQIGDERVQIGLVLLWITHVDFDVLAIDFSLFVARRQNPFVVTVADGQGCARLVHVSIGGRHTG